MAALEVSHGGNSLGAAILWREHPRRNLRGCGCATTAAPSHCTAHPSLCQSRARCFTSSPYHCCATARLGGSLRGIFRYSGRALALVWSTNRALSIALAVLTLIAGVAPAGIAYVGALIVDSVVHAIGHPDASRARVLWFVAAEGLLVMVIAAAQRGISLCQSLLRAQLGQRVNVMILEKALTLELQQFEDSEFYDKLTRARREASSRPLSLVMRTFGLVQNAVSLASYLTLLVQFSPIAVVLLICAGLPSFLA